jgi:hypothetical protein
MIIYVACICVLISIPHKTEYTGRREDRGCFIGLFLVGKYFAPSHWETKCINA